MNRTATTYETRYAEPAPEPVAAPSLLDAVLAATGEVPSEGKPAPQASGRLERFLHQTDVGEAVKEWFGSIPSTWNADLKGKLTRALNRDVARVDELLNAQLNAVMHHPAFQKLESSWRGLKYLVDQVPEGANVKIRVMQATWKELTRDQERALEFDQSQLFRKVYSEEFGTPGGEPYGMLIGDYELTHRAYPDHPTDDLAALRGISGVAAAAFVPFITGIDPRFFELESFTELELPLDLERTFEQLDYVKWRAFRETEDSRFVGLALPRVIYRRPYSDDPGGGHGFAFREDTADPSRKGYLWGNPCFAFAAVAARAFADSSWLADVRGARPDATNGGRVMGLPSIGYGTGRAETARSVADAHLTETCEKELSDLGFVPLCHMPGVPEAAFYSTPSAQRPKSFDTDSANANAKLSAMLHYMLCVSRFAHYLKVIMRDRVGSFTSPSDVERLLADWLAKYVVSNEDASNETKARYPLREGKVKVWEVAGKPGTYQCTIFLRPHFQLDQLSAGIRLTTQLNTRPEG
ncbi:MAG: type VI secretion system contractile sheath large subunit [Planctomycetia bacterium]|nr:type VI secretion system contractile sheath large subunit [Planctomycetia bacterium]